MPIISWSPALSVKINEIDTQHKKLIDLINQLGDAMKEGKSKDVLGKILSQLIEYTVYHFSKEEELMKKHAYPAFAQHKKLHDDLTAKVKELSSNFAAGKTAVGVETMNFLRDWLNNHIMGTDKQYTPYLNGKGVK